MSAERARTADAGSDQAGSRPGRLARSARLDDLRTFARCQVESGDMDPVYPVLRHVISALRLSPDEAWRLTVLYVAYYDLPSALTVWLALDGWSGQRLGELARLPTGIERRGLRGGTPMVAHLDALDVFCRTPGWPRSTSWETLTADLMTVPGNGRWAAYKTCELAQKVLRWPVTPTDAGHAWSTGPRQGLALLYGGDLSGNGPRTIARLNERTAEVEAALVGTGVADVAEVETVLCDFKALVEGRYYVGHDIDLMLDQARTAPGPVWSMILAARATAFPARFLGEVRGWSGVQPHLRKAYRDHGMIEWWPTSG